MDKLNSKQSFLKYVYIAFIAVIIFILDVLSVISWFRNSIELISSPMYMSGMEFVQNVKSKVSNFQNISSNVNEIDSLNIKISQLEAKSAEFESLKEKYNQLLVASKVMDKKYSYLQSAIFLNSNLNGYTIPLGNSDGVVVGDCVILGNIYIGEVTKVDSHFSKVRSADDLGSSLSVYITKDKLEDLNSLAIAKKFSNKYVKAVAIGENEKIKIENIATNSGVSNGDSVIVADPQKGDFYLLGTISDLTADSTASVLSAYVLSSVDIYNLKYVYVRK